MPDWHVWTSPDLVHWEHATTILPTQTYIGNSSECWAVDVARSADGSTFAFYFSHGGSDTGVMTATDPALSDAKDALGRPLLAASTTKPPAVHVTSLTRGAYDPTVLVDDDATTYLCLGLRLGGSYIIARLEPSLVALAEEPHAIVVLPHPATGATMPGDDKSTLHKHLDTYYLSAGAWYATASFVYGPYTFRGSSNPQVTRNSTSRTFGLTHQAHGRYFTFRGQWFHVWCEFISENNTGTKDPESPNYRYRDSWMVYTHYLENGEMEDDWNFLDAHGSTGVGQYDASWEQIEAEWYMIAAHADKVQPVVQPARGVSVQGSRWTAEHNGLVVRARAIISCRSTRGCRRRPARQLEHNKVVRRIVD
jgi:arabinoxylan arabinofuranohydrolase